MTSPEYPCPRCGRATWGEVAGLYVTLECPNHLCKVSTLKPAESRKSFKDAYEVFLKAVAQLPEKKPRKANVEPKKATPEPAKKEKWVVEDYLA